MKFDIPNGISFFFLFFFEFCFDEEICCYEIWDDGKKGMLKKDLQMLRDQVKKEEEINPHRACLSSYEKNVQLLHLQSVL